MDVDITDYGKLKRDFEKLIKGTEKNIKSFEKTKEEWAKEMGDRRMDKLLQPMIDGCRERIVKMQEVIAECDQKLA